MFYYGLPINHNIGDLSMLIQLDYLFSYDLISRHPCLCWYSPQLMSLFKEGLF